MFPGARRGASDNQSEKFLTSDKVTEWSKAFKLKAVPDSTFYLPIACHCQTKHIIFYTRRIY